MTTKERLRELVESLDEDATIRALIFLEADQEMARPLTSAERAAVLRALAQSEAGEYASSDSVFARYDLD